MGMQKYHYIAYDPRKIGISSHINYSQHTKM